MLGEFFLYQDKNQFLEMQAPQYNWLTGYQQAEVPNSLIDYLVKIDLFTFSAFFSK